MAGTTNATTTAKVQKIVCGKKKKSNANIQRKCETDCFSVGVVHLRAETVCTMMNTRDPFNPESEEEAAAIAEGCAYIGTKVPSKCSEKLDGPLPVPKVQYVYCNLPFMEKKESCIAYGKKRDQELNVEYDRVAKRCRGGVADPRDVNENKTIAVECGIHFRKRDDEESIDGTVVHGLAGVEVKKYENMVAEAVFGFQQAQNEVTRLCLALKKAEQVAVYNSTVGDDDPPRVVEVPGDSPEFKRAREIMDKRLWSATVEDLVDRFNDDLRLNVHNSE